MTHNEFKAWFQGFSEGIEGRPTQKQWDRVVEQIGKIDGVTAIPHYIDRVVYRDRYLPNYPLYTAQSTVGSAVYMSATSSTGAVMAAAKNAMLKTSLGVEKLLAQAGRDDFAKV